MKTLLWGVMATGCLACGYLTYSALKQKEPLPTAQTCPEVKPDAKVTVEQALRDASLLDLIKNARVATRKGDDVTRTAMLAGLRKELSRAKLLIQREKAKSKDETDVAILTRIEGELQ